MNVPYFGVTHWAGWVALGVVFFAVGVGFGERDGLADGFGEGFTVGDGAVRGDGLTTGSVPVSAGDVVCQVAGPALMA